MKHKKPHILIASYGGGHSKSLLPVIKKLVEHHSVSVTVFGFTTAKKMFENVCDTVLGYSDLPNEDTKEWNDFISPFFPSPSHPSIEFKDTRAYFSVCIQELISQHGEQAALELLEEKGRSCFLPISTFERFLKEHKVDLVVTSSSPRSELALQMAAVNLDISSISVTDLFLQHESKYICDDAYAKVLTTCSKSVKEYLVQQCAQSGKEIYVTGNPSFDSLIDIEYQNQADDIRRELQLDKNKKIIVWICATVGKSLVGKRFVDEQEISNYLNTFCSNHPNYSYLLRPHPNHRRTSEPLDNELSCTDMPIETCLHMGDVFIMETSTVGIQAALLNKPVITLNADNYPPYEQLGLAVDVSSIPDLSGAILAAKKPDLSKLGYPQLGTATDSVTEIILRKCLPKELV